MKNTSPVSDTPNRYHKVIISLHWLSAILVLLAVCFILGREWIDSRSLRHALVDLHRQCGLLVLLFAFPRLITRLMTLAPAPDASIPPLLQWVAKLTHLAIYGFMFTLPLLGWAISGAKGQTLALLGVIPLPNFISASPDLADTIEQWHGTLAWVFLALIALHAGAALWHHLMLQDSTLQKMLPFVKTRIKQAELVPAPSTGEN